MKVWDRERVEPPHIAIMRKTNFWRWGLRNEQFLDSEPDPKEVPEEILQAVRESITLLRSTWDRMYPENPIVSKPVKSRGTERKGKPKRKHK